MFYFLCFLWPLLSYLFWFCIMFLNARSECRILAFMGKITGCYIHSHACIQRTLIPDNRLVPSRSGEMRCLTAPFSLWARADAGHFFSLGCEGARRWASRARLRFRGLWLSAWPRARGLRLGLQGWAQSLPCSSVSHLIPLPARILICAKYWLCQTRW